MLSMLMMERWTVKMMVCADGGLCRYAQSCGMGDGCVLGCAERPLLRSEHLGGFPTL